MTEEVILVDKSAKCFMSLQHGCLNKLKLLLSLPTHLNYCFNVFYLCGFDLLFLLQCNGDVVTILFPVCGVSAKIVDYIYFL